MCLFLSCKPGIIMRLTHPPAVAWGLTKPCKMSWKMDKRTICLSVTKNSHHSPRPDPWVDATALLTLLVFCHLDKGLWSQRAALTTHPISCSEEFLRISLALMIASCSESLPFSPQIGLLLVSVPTWNRCAWGCGWGTMPLASGLHFPVTWRY